MKGEQYTLQSIYELQLGRNIFTKLKSGASCKKCDFAMCTTTVGQTLGQWSTINLPKCFKKVKKYILPTASYIGKQGIYKFWIGTYTCHWDVTKVVIG